MFPIDPNAPGGSDRSESLRRSYFDHTVLSGQSPAGARESGIPGAELVARRAVNGIALSHRAGRSPAGSQGAVAA